MYDIYIKNYLNADGTPILTEQLLYSIPITNPLNTLIDPVVKTEMGKTGTCEFSLHPKHLYFNCFQQMKTILRIVYDGTTLFRGRVLTIDNETLKGDRKFHCEGDLAFLLDSMQSATKEENRKEIDILTYLNQIINNHNMQVIEDGSDDKVIRLGEVPGQYTSATNEDQRVVCEKRKFGSNSYETSMSALETVQKEFGGYFRTRYENGTCYLDWLDNWYSDGTNQQTIEVGQNLIDLQDSTEVDNIFTALIPVGSAKGKDVTIADYKTEVHGHNNRILVPQIVGEFSDAELNKGFHRKEQYVNAVDQYGIIYKTQKFANADTQEKLWTYACDWIRNNYAGGLTSFSLSALDMHHVNGEVSKYLTGDLVRIKYPTWNTLERKREMVDSTMTLTQATYYLHHPEKNQYEVGIPNSILNKTYGKASNSKGGGGGGAGGHDDTEDESWEAEFGASLAGLDAEAWRYLLNGKRNSDEYKEFLKEHPEWDPEENPGILRTGWNIIRTYITDPESKEAKVFNNIVIHDGKIEMSQDIQGAGAVLNPTFVDAGKVISSLVFDSYNNSIELREKHTKSQLESLLDPATAGEFFMDGEDVRLNFWKKGHRKQDEEPVIGTSVVEDSINSVKQTLGLDGTGDASTLQLDGLQSTFELFDPRNAKDDPLTKLSTVFTQGTNGGQINAGRDGTTSDWKTGLNETLTYLDADGNEQTSDGFVRGTDVQIEGIPSLYNKTITTDQLIAKKADITELNALTARINTLEANMISTEWLEAMIAKMRVVSTIRLDANQFNFAGEALFMQNSPGFITDINYRPPALTLGSVQTFQLANGGTATGRLVSTYAPGSLTTTNRAIRYLGRYTSG